MSAAAELSTPPEPSPADRARRRHWTAARLVHLAGGPALLLLTLLTPSPQGLDPAGWHMVGLGLWMAWWWMTEVIPIPATALLPLAAFPLLDIADSRAAAAPYADPVIFLFMGGFLLAIGMQRWQLHRRLALAILRRSVGSPSAVVFGFMLATAVLSAWVSNTATVMMMFPIALSVIAVMATGTAVDPARKAALKDSAPGAAEIRAAEAVDPGLRRFRIALLLGVAYAASIGGVTTLIGTPPNAQLAGFMGRTYGVEIGFGRWMLLGVPLAAVTLPLVHWWLTRVVYPLRGVSLGAAGEQIDREWRSLGRMSGPEWTVAAVVCMTACAWVARPFLGGMPWTLLNDTAIAITGALLLFLLPAWGQGRPLLVWEDAKDLPWGVLVLFGGGLALAHGVSGTGVAEWLAGGLGAVDVPLWLLVALAGGLVLLLTELTSNTATAAAFLPVVAAVAVGRGADPMLLAVPTALAASCAFMLPVATPPNAIVYGSGWIRIRQMATAGLGVNLLFILLLPVLVLTLGRWVFGY